MIIKLANWQVSMCEESGEYLCEHYVGGEDGWVFDVIWSFDKEKIIQRQAALNIAAEEFEIIEYIERQSDIDACESEFF
jgi:hypothetical protein